MIKYVILLLMKKVFREKKYLYYCNKIRANYQAKRQPKRCSKRHRQNTATNKCVEYESLKLNTDDINQIIKDMLSLTKENTRHIKISFRKLKSFDLGLCLMFVSILEHFSKERDIKFAFKKQLMPKNKRIKDMFIRTGIFELLCNKHISPCDGQLAIKRVMCGNHEHSKNILLEISRDIVDFALSKTSKNDKIIKRAKNHLNRMFSELLLNVKSHANAPNEISYIAAEITQGAIKFSILDKGIGFAESAKKHSKGMQKIDDIVDSVSNQNMVKIIFEGNRERDKDYSGPEFRRGNGTKRLLESIEQCKGAKMQIVSKKDFYEVCHDKDEGMIKNASSVEKHKAVGTLISFELPIKEFLSTKETYDENI